ncbi:MAG: hypothetical protein M1834_002499 [Cirrosporium novae-zelandiae]|nr:MAG: hypothetical protein M1834_002499 [Cirrosporium novae-zelandiae]
MLRRSRGTSRPNVLSTSLAQRQVCPLCAFKLILYPYSRPFSGGDYKRFNNGLEIDGKDVTKYTNPRRARNLDTFDNFEYQPIPSQAKRTSLLKKSHTLNINRNGIQPKVALLHPLSGKHDLHPSLGRGEIRRYKNTQAIEHESQSTTENLGEKPAGQTISNIRDRLRQWERDQPVGLDAELFRDRPDLPENRHQSLIINDPGYSLESFAAFRDEDIDLEEELLQKVDGDMEIDTESLQRGDLVELTNRKTSLGSPMAIYVRDMGTLSQFYTMTGDWTYEYQKTARFVVPKFVPEHMLDEIEKYFPTSEIPPELYDSMQSVDVSVPRLVGRPVLAMMVEFMQKSHYFAGQHATQLDHIHDIVADEQDYKKMTVDDIGFAILGEAYQTLKTQPHVRYAIFRKAYEAEYEFADLRFGPCSSFRFLVRPKSRVRIINAVQDLVREYQERTSNAIGKEKHHSNSIGGNTMDLFISKARELIEKSRKMRVPTLTGALGPTIKSLSPSENKGPMLFKKIPGGEWSSQEQMIISFMLSWTLCTTTWPRYSHLSSIGAMILNAVGAYQGYPLNNQTALLFLQEVGAVPPWCNLVGAYEYHPALGGISKEQRVHELNAMNQSQPEIRDSLKTLRHDFKDLEVFCIDDITAREIDDGISVERIPGSDEYWVHVHVANPAAFIEPHSPISEFAENMVETVYFPENVRTMLPYSIRSRCSLAPGSPTLSISMRVSRDAELLQTEIRPGIIRNVTYISPNTVSKLLHHRDEVSNVYTLTVGGDLPTPHRDGIQTELSTKQKDAMQIIQNLASAYEERREMRIREVVGDAPFKVDTQGQLDVSVHAGQFMIPLTKFIRPEIWHYQGDPIIQLRSQQQSVGNPPPSIVKNIMVMAGEAAAKWSNARNIPIVYRGTVYRHSSNIGFSSFPAKSRSSAYPHLGLGIDAFTRVTSPLRRYQDLVTHWQIQAAILEEHKTGKSLIDNNESSYLFFSRNELDKILPILDLTSRFLSWAKRRATKYWAMHAIHRAWKFHEAPLPSPITGLFHEQVSNNKYIWLDQFGVLAHVLEPEQMESGDRWEVEIESIGFQEMAICVRLVRCLSKDNPR